MADVTASRSCMILYRIYNSGEIPSLAHGWRSVVALPPGRRWIKLVDWTTLETARIEIAAWDRLEPQADSRMNRRKVRTLMRARLKYTAPTQAIAQAIRLLKARTP